VIKYEKLFLLKHIYRII